MADLHLDANHTDFSAFWQALEPLHQLDIDTQRLFHGRGHCYPGLEYLNADFFTPAGLLLVTLYQQAPNDFAEQLLSIVNDYPVVSKVLIQHRYQAQSPSEWLLGEPQDKVPMTVNGLNYWIYPGQQQNVGFFLDMEQGRHWLQNRAKDKKVLNLFAYTCAFSVVALEAGAAQVVNLDMSSASLAKGRENHRLNQHDMKRVKFFGHDLFKSWGKLKRSGPFDIIVIDPPSFQKGSFVATKDYQRVLKRLVDLTTPGSEILVCLNDPGINSQFLLDLMTEHCPVAHFQEKLAITSSFPEKDPEKGLKALVFSIQT